MAITVGELLAVPSVDTRLIAGAAGLGRLISWAHVCELAEPWDWFGENDLLMTTGLGVPEKAVAQAQYVERLAGVGAAGIAIGDHMHAPPITPAMHAAADATGLPLLLTAREVPFMAISRLVAGISARENQQRLASTERIYGYMRTLATVEDPDPLLAALSQELQHRLLLVEGNTIRDAEGAHGLDDDAAMRALVEAARTAQVTDHSTLVRLRDDSRTLAIALPPPNPAILLAIPEGGQHTDLGLVQHAAAVIAAQRATAGAGRERARRLGASLFARLVDGTIDSTVAIDELADRGLAQTRYVLAASATDDTEEWANLHHRLDAYGIGHLLLVRGGITLAMVPAESRAIDAVSHHLPPAARLGASEPFDKVSETRSATLQARWALHQGQRGGDRVTHFAPSQTAVGFLPISLADNERAARRVLGPLLAYDEDKRSHLVESLRVFLEENRSWQRAAARLHVHKQTLVYRIERVEQLTGRALDSTADVAELWLAIQAAMACGLIDI
jgi:purine catabolism regulator